MAITTPIRVRNRIQAAEADISDDVLNEFIADEQAFIEAYAQKTFPESDPQFGLARSICTDRCAAKGLVFITAPSAGVTYTIDELKVDKTDPANARLSLAQSLWAHAGEQLALLNPSTRLVPRSSTAR
jgi:hypothetical protein